MSAHTLGSHSLSFRLKRTLFFALIHRFLHGLKAGIGLSPGEGAALHHLLVQRSEGHDDYAGFGFMSSGGEPS